MSDQPTGQTGHIFAIVNPVAGRQGAEQVRDLLKQASSEAGHACEIYETTGEESLSKVVEEALEGGCRLVVVAGGDGTVSSVATAMESTEVPLGILPTGTANVIARELGIPKNLEAACRLIMHEHAVTHLDALQVGERRFFLRIGIGLDALMIRDTNRQHKRLLGRLAYVWSFLKRLSGYQPRRFTLTIDEQQHKRRAAQVLIANTGMVGTPALRWSMDIHPDDGHVDVCVILARTLRDYVVLFWHMLIRRQQHTPRIRCYQASKLIQIQADKALPVQADGEMVGNLPLQVQVVPQAVRVIVPPERAAPN